MFPAAQYEEKGKGQVCFFYCKGPLPLTLSHTHTHTEKIKSLRNNRQFIVYFQSETMIQVHNQIVKWQQQTDAK